MVKLYIMDLKLRTKKLLALVGGGIVINIALAIIKMYVGLSSNSVTIMLDATNSFLDILTLSATEVAMFMLLASRSERAPHGYGRGEYLAGFVVAVVTVVMGGVFFMRSLNRMAMPEPIWFGLESCILIAVCVPLKLAIGLTYYFFNRRLKSKALRAIMLDSFLDMGITLTSLVSFAVSSYVNYAVDAIVGIVLSIVIVIFGIKMVLDNIRSVVVGDALDEEKRKIAICLAEWGYKISSFDAHDYGYGEKLAEIVLAFDGDISMNDADKACRECESKLKNITDLKVRVNCTISGLENGDD